MEKKPPPPAGDQKELPHGSIPQGKREEWRTWAEKNIVGNPGAVGVATDAILDALVRGCTVEQAMDAGRTAARRGVADEPAKVEHPLSDLTHLRGQVSAFRERNELMGNQFGPV